MAITLGKMSVVETQATSSVGIFFDWIGRGNRMVKASTTDQKSSILLL